MSSPEQPQIYLITPPELELSTFPDALTRVLDQIEIACLRLSLATRDEDLILRAADVVRDIAHRFDVALVIETHILIAKRLGLDGVHLLDGPRSVRMARKELGEDAIVGAYCGQSRHDGMTAGEAGADYISFGPVGDTSLGDGGRAAPDLFEWWSQMIEIPVVAEGDLGVNTIHDLSGFTDFFGIGEEIWRSDDPAQALATLQNAFSQ